MGRRFTVKPPYNYYCLFSWWVECEPSGNHGTIGDDLVDGQQGTHQLVGDGSVDRQKVNSQATIELLVIV